MEDGKPRSRNPWPSRPPHPLNPINSHIEKVELLPHSLPHGGVDPFFSYSTLPILYTFLLEYHTVNLPSVWSCK
ncbi:hypothetical protein NEUTE2DRAFT_68757 [Neurospora tetrasperma FGSC 2509]|nr:hypothetical protein NEUTE2DRAFT_68757 [Neurospora tetrasperma FGSC 2509]